MYTIYMVCRSTVCNQSEILPVGASWPGDFVAVSILFLAPSQVVISIQHMWYLLLVIYIYYQYTIHTVTCLGDIYKYCKTKLVIYISNVNFESMFRKKKKPRLSLDCENKSPTKDSNILLNGTSINAMYLVSYWRYMYDLEFEITLSLGCKLKRKNIAPPPPPENRYTTIFIVLEEICKWSASKPKFKDFNKLAISPSSKNKTNNSWVDLMIYLSYWLVTQLTLTFDGVSVVCVILLVCMGGGSLSPRPVLCYWGPYQWGSVHRFKGPPSPRDQFILILGLRCATTL